MVTEPRPKPLSVTQAKIEKEKLEVLKQTERRIAEIGAVAEAQIPQSSLSEYRCYGLTTL